jgi:hypothetical protein
LVFGRRNRKEAEEAAREADRSALFAELAKRPDTVCPFLGMADARTEYTEGVDDKHRCYAFGDPAELSAEQQTKVCLQRGYGNCPRYLRGVLVIPTEELEALRRPPPPIQPRPAKPAARPRERRRLPGWLLTAATLLVAAAAIGGASIWYLGQQVASSAAAATLPGGTDLSAELLSLSAPDGGSQQLRGRAQIGAAAPAANSTLIYVLDLSASTRRGDGCGSDVNGDGGTNTLDCEIAAAQALNEQAISTGAASEVGLVGFATGSVAVDLSPADGEQVLVSPDADEDEDGTPDVVQAMRSAFTASRGNQVGFTAFAEQSVDNVQTFFSAGITAACGGLSSTDNPNRLVVFLSDGANGGGEPIADVLPCDPAAVFHTFAAGPGASCADPGELGGLQDMSDTTDGTCTPVIDVTQLPEILEAVVSPKITGAQLTIDGGEPIDLATSLQLPRNGPATLDVIQQLPALGEGSHRLCLTITASDAGGSGSVESCSPADADGGPLTD